jgi:hypothetical protein
MQALLLKISMNVSAEKSRKASKIKPSSHQQNQQSQQKIADAPEP